MPEPLLVTLLSLVLVVICVTIHYETLNLLERVARGLNRHRWIILVCVHGMLVAHVLEIWIFGFAYYLAEHELGMGAVSMAERGWFSYIYYSAMVYTTVGFGDLVPVGSLRMLTSTEALVGLALITWSASFTFLQMQRMWRR